MKCTNGVKPWTGNAYASDPDFQPGRTRGCKVDALNEKWYTNKVVIYK